MEKEGKYYAGAETGFSEGNNSLVSIEKRKIIFL